MHPTHILPRLTINTALARTILVAFLRDAIHKVGFTRAVIGLSGGIDSALSAYLTAEAIGPENVLVIRMPYKSSSQNSLDDAQAVIDDLGVQADTVDITPMIDPMLERFPEASQLRRGNIMARMRMIVLYDQSVAFNGLVIGTSNKTETLLGYSTIFGDNAAAVQPIADLYKAQVNQLCVALGVPQAVIDKAPSADLWEGQTDEDELGFSYDLADQLLYLLVDERYTVDEVVAEGFDRALVEKIVRQVRMNHYKRTMPNVAKLSRRDIGHDFLYLRDWSG
ncbi:MAG: NAD+ synthase [Anaerolineae bacterium]|nr:NAD+ synthase [Anaerolineae bacterium]